MTEKVQQQNQQPLKVLNEKEVKKGPKEIRFESIDKSKLPPTYLKNSQREELLLDYSNAFETQFLSQFPSRKPLYISPLNEGGLQKFICTTLRPALLQKTELCSATKLVQFVSQSVNYEQLAEPTEFSQVVQAPQTTLEYQLGDSIDISILLSSLLLGAGYNAYVVLGMADRRLTEQITNKEFAPEFDQFRQLSKFLLIDYAAEAAFAFRSKTGLFKIPGEYCRDFNDYQEAEVCFKREQFINYPQFHVTQLPAEEKNNQLQFTSVYDINNIQQQQKELYNFFIRPTLQELSVQANLNVADQDFFNLLKAGQLQSQQLNYKNIYGFNKLEVMNQNTATNQAELQNALSGSGQYLSSCDFNYGANLLCAPIFRKREDIGGVYKNKFFRTRQVVPESHYEKMEAMRRKMKKIGARPVDVDSHIIETFRQQGLLSDIVVPGETGNVKRDEEAALIKSERELDQKHVAELYQDILEGQRMYAWVYIAPNGDKYQDSIQTDVNVLRQQAQHPSTVTHGMFIDAVSGRIMTLTNKLFLGVESVFNNENYFVSLQQNLEPNQYPTFDLYDIDKWCICVMTEQLVKLRKKQQRYVNKYAAEEQVMKEIGGNSQYIKEYKNAQIDLQQGIDLPDNVNKIIQNQINAQLDLNYQQSINQPQTEFQLLNKPVLTTLQEKYKHRWDSVEPVRILMSSIPTAWPVQTTLSDLKILQNYPLRPKLDYENIKVDAVPEKTYLYKDCFVRLFNRYSERNGCTMLLVSRPRPVYQSFYDLDGDCIKNNLVAWRFARYMLFEDRIDKLGSRVIQYEIKHEDIKQELHSDKYKQLNDGLEIITQLDTKKILLNNKEYPLWCFAGDDLDEFQDKNSSVNANVAFYSFSHEIYSQVKHIQQIFQNGRADQIKSQEILPSGLRRTQFYENREDLLGQMIIDNQKQEIIEKYYDYLRLDGLQQRNIKYSLEKLTLEVKDNNTDNITLKITHFNTDTKQYDQTTVYIVSIEEKFRDMGHIQQTINSRRRKFIQAKAVIMDADAKFVMGQQQIQQEQQEEQQEEQKQETISFIQDEHQYIDLDFFAEIEASLTLAAYQIFVAQKQIFSSNISSVNNPFYNITQGTQSIVKRHHNLLLQAYNLCPEKEMLELQYQIKNAQQASTTIHNDHTMRNSQSQVSTSETIDESKIEDNNDTIQSGPQFWRKTAKKLKNEDSQKSTMYLKMDIDQLAKTKAQMILPKNIFTFQALQNTILTGKQLTENEMRKLLTSNYLSQNHAANYFYNQNTCNDNMFNLTEYVALLKLREMPILPQFKSSPHAYSYVKQFIKDPIRCQKLFYNLKQNSKQIILSQFNDQCTFNQIYKIYDEQSSYCHFMKIFSIRSDKVYIQQQYTITKHLLQKQVEILRQSKKNQQLLQNLNLLQPLQNQNVLNGNLKLDSGQLFFQAESQLFSNNNSAVDQNVTTVLQVSDEHVHLIARQKALFGSRECQFLTDNEAYFKYIDSIQQNAETKLISDLVFFEKEDQIRSGNSLNIYNQNIGKGLLFKPRDLLVARHALKQHGTEERFSLKTEKRQEKQQKLDNNDHLLPFVEKRYRALKVLPAPIAQKVYEDAMKSMKERILERTGYIQSRLQAETVQLQKANRSLEQLSNEEKERTMRDIKESIFRIRIIETRTVKHIEDGTLRYEQYEKRIRADPRMANLQK